MIYEDNICFIKRHTSHIPWLEIHAKANAIELSDDENSAKHIFALALKIEKAMREFYNPIKINHASFANEYRQMHWHVMARFSDDGYYPKNLWQEPLAECKNYCENFDEFVQFLREFL